MYCYLTLLLFAAFTTGPVFTHWYVYPAREFEMIFRFSDGTLGFLEDDYIRINGLSSAYHKVLFSFIGFASPELTLSSHPSILNSPTADLTRRAFWHCSVMETYGHIPTFWRQKECQFLTWFSQWFESRAWLPTYRVGTDGVRGRLARLQWAILGR